MSLLLQHQYHGASSLSRAPPLQHHHNQSDVAGGLTSPSNLINKRKKEKLFRNLLAFFGLLKLSEHQLIKYRSSKLENTGELIPGESIIIQNKIIHLQCLCSKRWTMGYARLLNENFCLNKLKETLRYNLEQKYIGKIEIRFIKLLKDMWYLVQYCEWLPLIIFMCFCRDNLRRDDILKPLPMVNERFKNICRTCFDINYMTWNWVRSDQK